MAKNANGTGGKKGKKNRKHLRNKMRSPSAKNYIAQGRCLKNKAKKYAKHLKSHPNDKPGIFVKVDYKVVKLKPEDAAELKRIINWRNYLRSA